MVARSTWEGQTIVWKLGCRVGTRLNDVAIDQLEKALSLRRDLVSLSREADVKRQAIWDAHPAVGLAQAEVDRLGTQLGEVAERAKKERVQDRTTKPRTQTAEDMKLLKKQRAEAKAALKVAKAAAMDAVKVAMDALGKEILYLEKTKRQKAVEGGLYWSTANSVLDDHRQAQKMVIATRKEGRAAERRMPRWNSPATLSTQVMWGQGKPKRTAELLASGTGPWRNVVQLTPHISPKDWPKGRGRHRLGLLKLRVAGEGSEPLVLPVIIHRPIPDEAEITDVQVTQRMVADQKYLTVALTLRLPLPPAKKTGEVVAVRIGWKGVKQGWVRVARIATPTGPLKGTVPAKIRHIVRVTDTCTEILASPEISRIIDRCDRIRGYRDVNLEEIKKQVVAALQADQVLMDKIAAELQDPLEVGKWRASRRMVRLWKVWPDDHPLKETLNEWRKRDKHLWQFEAHERQQTITKRREWYRIAAAWVCSQAKRIGLSEVDIAKLTMAPGVDKEDTQQAQRARANRQWTAPGEFRDALRNAAQRRGVEIIGISVEPEEEDDDDTQTES